MAMDFFEHQDRARRRTGLLVFLFVLAVTLILVTICTVIGFAIWAVDDQYDYGEDPATRIVRTLQYNWFAFVCAAGFTVVVIFLGSLYKTSQLASGGQVVAEMLGGRLIQPGTGTLAEQRLMNVVQEMAIASGTAVPPVYVLDNEQGINAFAAGFEPDSAVVAVTRGTLDYLDRDELQGVIGHEFSHILNGDMRLNIRLIGIIHGILVIALVGYYVLRSLRHVRLSSSSNRKGGGGVLAILLALLISSITLIVVGYIGVFIGNLIKSAVSRQREFLADASSVQFTRNPEGLAGALAKIGGIKETSRIDDPHAQEISHMFFANALNSHLFSTHPPLLDRIQRIMPGYSRKFDKVQPIDEPRTDTSEMAAAVSAAAPLSPSQPSEEFMESSAVDPVRVVSTIGEPADDHLRHAAAVMAMIPDQLQQVVVESYGARAIIYALLLDRDEKVQEVQLARLRTHAEELSYRQTLEIASVVARMPAVARVPLADLCVTPLRALAVSQYEAFRENLKVLVEADQQVDQSEYVLWAMVVRHLDQHFGIRKAPRVRYHAMTPITEQLQVVISTLARIGYDSSHEVQSAFDAGMRELGQRSALLPQEACSLNRFDKAMQELARTSPGLKRRIMRAASACVLADSQTTIREFELLRAVSATLDCPMPPLVVTPSVAT